MNIKDYPTFPTAAQLKEENERLKSICVIFLKMLKIL